MLASTKSMRWASCFVGGCRMTELKLIFIDFDGVLNTPKWIRRYGISLDPAKVGLLNQLCWRTGADVVVSSTWRHTRGYESALLAAGFRGHLVGTTGRIRMSRFAEILEFVEKRPGPHPWVAIDDDRSIAQLGEHAILCDPGVGLTQENVDRAAHILREIR